MNTPTLLTVCTGNICRSPLLERLLQARFDDAHGAGAVRVESAGTGALVGSEMDERSARILRDLGGDPEGFVSRQLQEPMVTGATLVLTATRDHRAAVSRMSPRAMKATYTFRELADIASYLEEHELPDATDPAERLRQVVALARTRRGWGVPANAPELDVVDPYRQGDDVYRRMRSEVVEALPPVLKILGL